MTTLKNYEVRERIVTEMKIIAVYRVFFDEHPVNVIIEEEDEDQTT